MKTIVISDSKDYDEQYEKEFKQAIEEVAYYQGNIERSTIDGEWASSELDDCLFSDCKDILLEMADSFKYRAVYNKNLLLPEFLSNEISDNNDLIEIYNSLYSEHLHDENKAGVFTIHYFDEKIKKIAKKLLNENLAK